jgi:transcriptional regulator with XRE-family HTH domain
MPTSKAPHLPQRLRELRLKAGLSQAQLADATGLERKSIIRYENGQGTPNGNSLRALSHFFGISVDYLLGESKRVKETDLSPIEQEAIQAFRLAKTDDQRRRLLEALLQVLQAEQS